MVSVRYISEIKLSESVCGLCAVFFLGRICKLNLESRGMFTELSYLNIILTIINIIMLIVRHMLESKKRHLKQSKTPAQHYRPLSRRLVRCDHVIQKESDDSIGGNV